ncbi:CLAVATA3/ESR (CLE)-related protein [Senna tora]|uniref:CLAVATA3/ESR (CLE)-related protein n=1 Tax=Senna tora TaxID=362788 RepID=A0A834TUM2_9FABA|nr:CLAVATA3/ESR (CLE)-related protein [Senna tora]
MSFAGGNRFLLRRFSPVVLLLFSLLQIWVCSHSSVGAIRIFPENAGAKLKLNHTNSSSIIKDHEHHRNRFFNKYFFFSGSTFRPTNNGTQKSFEESKRRVPSCPDPLHN